MSSLSHAASSAEKRTNARYWIVVMLFIVTSFNYGDRATLSIAGSEMAKDIGLDPVGMGLCYRADPGRLAAGPLWFQTRLFLVYFHLVSLHPVAGFCRYL